LRPAAAGFPRMRFDASLSKAIIYKPYKKIWGCILIVMNTNTTSNTDKDTVKPLLKELEKEGIQKTAEIIKGSNGCKGSRESKENTTAALLDIMKRGSNTFTEKTGRNMTYSEMRQAWG
jgi:hypothetical protein